MVLTLPDNELRFAGNVVSAVIMAVMASLRFKTDSEDEEMTEIGGLVMAMQSAVARHPSDDSEGEILAGTP